MPSVPCRARARRRRAGEPARAAGRVRVRRPPRARRGRFAGLATACGSTARATHRTSVLRAVTCTSRQILSMEGGACVRSELGRAQVCGVTCVLSALCPTLCVQATGTATPFIQLHVSRHPSRFASRLTSLSSLVCPHLASAPSDSFSYEKVSGYVRHPRDPHTGFQDPTEPRIRYWELHGRGSQLPTYILTLHAHTHNPTHFARHASRPARERAHTRTHRDPRLSYPRPGSWHRAPVARPGLPRLPAPRPAPRTVAAYQPTPYHPPYSTHRTAPTSTEIERDRGWRAPGAPLPFPRVLCRPHSLWAPHCLGTWLSQPRSRRMQLPVAAPEGARRRDPG